ncbi:rRNA adenine N(6)-methyltransferase family protein [Saccharomonospora sp. NPDC046836]|uniref:ribosomal RNA small subunit methyltransferase A n=1 Tax=Saccharomonospora sp. NPDC046836 TaxID=3156921 RepID=UPI00340C5E0E
MPYSRPRRPARKQASPNPSGVHFLASARIADDLIRSCAPRPVDLVVDFGAGLGAITGPLARTGARVIAVERDAAFANQLSKRLAGNDNVRVINGDARTYPLPRKRFLVVSSIPYSISTVLMRRLLGDHATALHRAALIVEWGFAKRLATSLPRSREQAWWAARFDIGLRQRVPARHFRPAPTVDSAHLLIRRREGLSRDAERVVWALLDGAYRAPRRSTRAIVSAVTGSRAHGILRGCGVDPAMPAATVRPSQWAAIAIGLSAK